MTLAPDKERDRLESELCINLGAALITTKGYGSVEVGQAYSRALQLCESAGDNSGLYKALWGMWLTSSSRIGHLHSLELAEKLLHLAEQNTDPLQRQFAHYAMGNSLLWTGQLTKARFHLEQSIALFQPSYHAAMVRDFGENSCISSGSLLVLVLWLQGFPEQACDASQRTLALARQVNHVNSLGYALCTIALLNRWLKRIETTSLLAQEAMALSQEHGLPLWLGLGASFYGWVLAMQGQAAGVTQIQHCLAAANSIMSGTRVLFLDPLSEARIHLGQIDEALAGINETLDIVNAIDDRFLESEFHRLKGVCLLEISAANAAEAEICFSRALAVSRKQGAKSLELRATINIARLWQQRGRQDEAKRVLKEIYSWFTEGSDTHDLVEAANLLRTLSAPL